LKRTASDLLPPILPKSLKKFNLLDLDPLEVARQLTLIEMAIFQKISPIELMKQEWSRKKGQFVAVNVRAMTAMSTKITGWIISTILQESEAKKRYFNLKFFIKVGEVQKYLSVELMNSAV
jgi:son of sevenless-like protein